MSDNIVYQMSLDKSNPHDSPFQDRRQQYIFDSNAGNYANGQIYFDINLDSGEYYQDIRNATIQLPFIMMSTIADYNNSANVTPGAFGLGLKNGYYNLINSYSLFIENTCVENQVPFDNMRISYEVMSNLSYSDYQKWGRTLGFSMDTTMSNTFYGTSNTNGIGFSNILNAPATAPSVVGTIAEYNPSNLPLNYGLYERQSWSNYNDSGFSGICSNTQMQNVAHNYDDSVTNGGVQTYYQVGTIRLRDISKFINVMPLTKKCKMRIVLYPNQLTITQGLTVTSNTSTTGAKFIANPTITTVGQTTTNPMLIASTSTSQGNSSITITATNTQQINFIATLGIVSASLTLVTGTVVSITHPLGKCSMWVQAYKLNPEYERKYLESLDGGTRRLVYNEVRNFNFYGVKGTTNFSQKLFSGIKNPKKLIVFPLGNPSDVSGNIIKCSDLMSPCNPCPGSGGSPFIGGILNYQVSVGGRTLYPEALKYNFQQFLWEDRKSGISNGFVDGESSGMWNMWHREQGVCPYVSDLSRRENSENDTPLNISISGQNNNNICMDLYTFIESEVKADFNIFTGQYRRV